MPDNPDAWLLTVARRRQTDAVRRRQTRTAGEEHLQLMADEIEAAAANPEAIPDRRLALMFACAHPAIERGMRAPLILQTILGLTADRHRRRLPDPAGHHGPAAGARQDPHQGRRHPFPRPRDRRNCPSGSMPCSTPSMPPMPRAGPRSASAGTPAARRRGDLARPAGGLAAARRARGQGHAGADALCRGPPRRPPRRRRRLCAARGAGHQASGTTRRS